MTMAFAINQHFGGLIVQVLVSLRDLRFYESPLSAVPFTMEQGWHAFLSITGGVRMNHSPDIDIRSPDQRKQALTDWTIEQLKVLCPPVEPLTLHNLGSDAGFRRYYRAVPPPAGQPAFLAVDAPPETEDTALFVSLARYLRSQGVNAPRVLVADPQQGFLLVEDFGDRLLHRELSPDSVNTLYGEALMVLLRLQQATNIPRELPRYDQAMLRRELELFREWFVVKLLGYSLSADEEAMLQDVFTQLETAALEQPQLLVHRDFHSRNLLLCDSGQIGVIDFQGAVQGPFAYDLVSLLRDCYIRWPREDVQRWALSYGNMAMEVGVLPPVDEATYLRWFDWVGLQRHIKVLGIFARLHLRDGKDHYLADLPLVLRYTLEVAREYPSLRGFAEWMEQRLLPLAQQQDWYTDYRRAGELPQ